MSSDHRDTGQGAPSITLPKGGGALRGIDEKFSINAANGTCELNVPLPFSKTRSALDGSLSLRYSSGAGNGVFGLGWSTTLPSISRRTDRGLPRYDDEGDSDVYLFSGGEDLVPSFRSDGLGGWLADVRDVPGVARAVRYRPRIEGAFARIERIAVTGEDVPFWRVTSSDNVTTIFGRTAAARIADPDAPAHVFRWLPEWAFDDKGNCVEYVYKAEDLVNVPRVIDEEHRHAGRTAIANRHIKSIRYGNTAPYAPGPSALVPAAPAAPGYLFEALFDYGEHDADAPSSAEVNTWPVRFDPFSDQRAGFEIRTYRLCRRVLFFHNFAQLGATPTLVRSVDVTYRRFAFDGAPYARAEADFITSVRRTQYRRSGANAYARRSLPPLDLSVFDLEWDETVKEIAAADVVNAPGGVGAGYQWIDLYGDGVPGILTEQGQAWYFKENQGDGHFGRAVAVAAKPSFAGLATSAVEIDDLDADGSKQLVASGREAAGYFELNDDNEWEPFRVFEQTPSVDPRAATARKMDLDGDGRADLLVAEDFVLRWYPSRGRRGWDAPRSAPWAVDEEQGPVGVFANDREAIFIADMSGDGLADIVRVRNGEVCYWPNRGYGRFGAKVTMADAPLFDLPDQFTPRLVQLRDVSGTGAADLIYLGSGKFTAWINLAGNGWSAARAIDPFPTTEQPNRVSVLDLLGNGTACLVWSSELPANAGAPIRYVDLMGGRKPYLLFGYRNNLGLETTIEYRSSSSYALADRRDGHPWATKLPFPMLCVSRRETRDTVSGTRFVHEARYRHGYYDHAEREFRGFGMVEELDSETYERFSAGGGSNVVDAALHQPPRRTRTWFHTGAFLRGEKILGLFATDYFHNAAHPEHELPDAVVIAAQPLTPEEHRQAARACKGMVLRTEVYADDATAAASVPYSAAARNCNIRMLQPALGGRAAVFLPHESEALTYNYERDDADPRIVHTLNTVIDDAGIALEVASVAYGRLSADGTLPLDVQTAQALRRITYTVNAVTNDVDDAGAYRLRRIAETRVFELTGAAPLHDVFTPGEIAAQFAGAAPLGYEEMPHAGATEKRLIDARRTLFASDADPNLPLALQVLQPRGLQYETYHLVYTEPLRNALFAAKVTPAMLHDAHYALSDDLKAGGRFPGTDPDGQWWIPSGTSGYPANPEQHFYQPDRFIDPFGSTTTVHYEPNQLLIDRIDDALGNRTSVLSFDFGVLQAESMQDLNDNVTEVRYDILGFVAGRVERGKGAEADDFGGFVADLSQGDVDAFFADPVANGAALLQHATARFVYDFNTLPVAAASILRETHRAVEVARGITTKLQFSFEYSEGSGKVAMKKVQAEPGMAKQVVVHDDGTYTVTDVDTTPNLRWIGNGRTIVNNKGNPVMAFEPYFSVSHRYETAPELVESGVTTLSFYDPADRLIRKEYPDGSFERMVLRGWSKQTFDRNDNVAASDWFAARAGGALGAAEMQAAQQTLVHDGTPSTEHYDALGHNIYATVANRFLDRVTNAPQDEIQATRFYLDVEGNRLRLVDPRGQQAMLWAYDLAGRAAHTTNADAGERWRFDDAMAKPAYRWDAKGNRFAIAYDALHRPTEYRVLSAAAVTTLYEALVYGTDKTRNLVNRVALTRDGAGIVENVRFDFKGNLLEGRRTFAVDVHAPLDWTTPAAVALQAETYPTVTEYDAVNRIAAATTPDGSVTTPAYSEASLLTAVDVAVRGAAAQPFVRRITHDARGQRRRIEYGNDTATDIAYDAQTFRVRSITTTRGSDGAVLQGLAYTWDPMGNVVAIADGAQETQFFNNQHVLPDNAFTYDAAYRLVRATGREQIALNVPLDQFDAARTAIAHKADGNQVQRYRQDYRYDLAGNLLHMIHDAGNGAFTHQWTRDFTPAAARNRLESSNVGAAVESYTYDAHGNMTALSALPLMEWDFSDRLQHVDLGGGGNAYYVYDVAGNRARKVIERLGAVVEDRLYVGGIEVFTRTTGGGLSLRRETLHVTDGKTRLAMVDTRTDAPSQLIRYQFANHLGTAALELDDAGALITYEEYYPFGSTSFQSVDTTREVPAKRYRYTGKERDEESGLYYCKNRYYAPWLARWTSCDPAELIDGPNLYRYARNNPIAFSDPNGTDPPTDWQFRLGPVRLRDVNASVSGGLQFPPASGPLDLRLSLSGVAGINVDSPDISGPFSVNAHIYRPLPGIPSLYAASVTGRANLSLNLGSFRPVSTDIRADAHLTTLVPSGSTDFARDALGNVSGDASVTARVTALGGPAAYLRLSADVHHGQARLSLFGRAGLPVSSTQSLNLIRISGSGSFDLATRTGSLDYSATARLVVPLAHTWGTATYSPDRGFRVSGHYVGPQFGPLSLTPSLDPFAADRPPNMTASPGDPASPLPPATAPRSGGPLGTVQVYEPGFSLGYSHYSVGPNGSMIISGGISPHPQITDYNLEHPPLPTPLDIVPGLDERLYGAPQSRDARPFPNFYIGGSLRLTF